MHSVTVLTGNPFDSNKAFKEAEKISMEPREDSSSRASRAETEAIVRCLSTKNESFD